MGLQLTIRSHRLDLSTLTLSNSVSLAVYVLAVSGPVDYKTIAIRWTERLFEDGKSQSKPPAGLQFNINDPVVLCSILPPISFEGGYFFAPYKISFSHASLQ